MYVCHHVMGLLFKWIKYFEILSILISHMLIIDGCNPQIILGSSIFLEGKGTLRPKTLKKAGLHKTHGIFLV